MDPLLNPYRVSAAEAARLDASRNAIQTEMLAEMRDEFRYEVKEFLANHGFDDLPSVRIEPGKGSPVFIVTGATCTPYDSGLHGEEDTHVIVTAKDGQQYLLNNTAAIVARLLEMGHRVIAHSKNPAGLQTVFPNPPHSLKVFGGELGELDANRHIYTHLHAMGEEEPISNVRLMLYQSFAQNGGIPFAPLHKEKIMEVERAASRRLRFIYNMAALSYDLLMNRGQDELRIVSLSALAGQRATYGLIADAADKYMNELGWRTFFLEANASIGKPVSLFMVNPGITTACDVYRIPEVQTLVRRESIADGFPMDNAILTGRKPLPQLSSNDVAWVAETLLTTPYGSNPNDNMPNSVKSLLYGGFEPGRLRGLLRKAFRIGWNKAEINVDNTLPEHMFAPNTSYGKLPDRIEHGQFRRISLTPPGQTF